MAMDGTTLDLADTAENVAEFGRPGSKGDGLAAFPQLRLVGVAECGTHALVSVALGPYTSSEHTLAPQALGRLSDGMLLLADRGFYSFTLWNKAKASGAQLLWRTKSNHVLPVVERLSDGSYLSTLHEIVNFKRRREGIAVRVIEYTLTDPGRPHAHERYRLLSTILDPVLAPADELAALYADRWEFETLLDEVKTHQRGPRLVLRSKSPDGVRQETYGTCAPTTRSGR